MMTGEANPVDKNPGDAVTGGSINGEGILKFTVSKTGDETFISQVIKLVREAQQSKSRTQRLLMLLPSGYSILPFQPAPSHSLSGCL